MKVETLIKKHADCLDFLNFSRKIDIIQINHDIVIQFSYFWNWNWTFISIYQTLSQSFMEEFKENVKWMQISKTQNLSEEFIKKMKNYVWIKLIPSYKSKNLSEEFKNEFNLL